MKKITLPINLSSKPISSVIWMLMLISVMFIYPSCDDDDDVSVQQTPQVSPETVLAWNSQIQKAYTFTPDEGFPPPIISRFFAIYHVTMHDALNSIKPNYETYASTVLNEAADPDAAVTQAIYETLALLGPQEGPHKLSIDSLYNVLMGNVEDGEAKTQGIELGKSVAQAVLAKRSADAPYLQVAGYDPTPPSGTEPGVYQYLPPLNYALAGFHLMAPWAMTSGKQFPVEEPYAINSAEYTTDYDEVMKLGELNSTEITEDQRELGIFWAENTSRGWNNVATEILEKPGNTPEDAWEAARLFALLHMAIADAYISVFDSKMHYNYWRPITAIHEGENDGNQDTQGNPDWQATLATPPVGEYPSAHALTGSAAGQILIRHFGTSNISFTLDSGYSPNIRSFTNINEAIRENSLSRIYIGYHFRKAVDVGEEAGYELGDFIYSNALKTSVN